MDQLLAAYLAQLVEDAAHAVAGSFNATFPAHHCQQALTFIETRQPGSDRLIDAACVATGVEPAIVYRALLHQARRRAEAIQAGQRKPRTPKRVA